MKFRVMQFSRALYYSSHSLVGMNPRNNTECYSVFFFPVAPTLGHRSSVKRFVSFQCLNPKTVSRTPWTGGQPIARPLTEFY
jgi:hypothetical protein